MNEEDGIRKRGRREQKRTDGKRRKGRGEERNIGKIRKGRGDRS